MGSFGGGPSVDGYRGADFGSNPSGTFSASIESGDAQIKIPRILRMPSTDFELALVWPVITGASAAMTPDGGRAKAVNTSANARITWVLTMRLSDAGLRRRRTKLIYPNHRPPPWLTARFPLLGTTQFPRLKTT